MRDVDEVVERARAADRVLDVGGWYRPLNAATHVIDINDYDSRLHQLAWDAGAPERFSAATWVEMDICDRTPWPYPDDYFDFSVCSHVLEDIRDPVWVVSEIDRVSRSGYIECPSPAFELIEWIGRFPWPLTRKGRHVGSSHHRWLVELEPAASLVRFRMKPHDLAEQGRSVRCSSLHAVDFSRSAVSMFWEGKLAGEEVIFGLGDWIETLLDETRSLVEFRPVMRLAQAWGRRLAGPAPSEASDPAGARYPYQ